MPAAVGVNWAEVAVGGGAPPSGRLSLVKIGAPVQVGLAGPNRLKLTVPVGGSAGAGAPVTMAVSEMGSPRVTGVMAVVAMATGPEVTTDASSGAPHGLVTGV